MENVSSLKTISFKLDLASLKTLWPEPQLEVCSKAVGLYMKLFYHLQLSLFLEPQGCQSNARAERDGAMTSPRYLSASPFKVLFLVNQTIIFSLYFLCLFLWSMSLLFYYFFYFYFCIPPLSPCSLFSPHFTSIIMWLLCWKNALLHLTS